MESSFRYILLQHIDSASDADDLENFGDFTQSMLVAEDVQEWQLRDVLRQLHTMLVAEIASEKDPLRKIKLKAATSCFEAEFDIILIDKEVESFS